MEKQMTESAKEGLYLKINRRRRRAIEKAEKKLDRYENWKEHVWSVGGSLQKDKNGKYIGVLHVN